MKNILFVCYHIDHKYVFKIPNEFISQTVSWKVSFSRKHLYETERIRGVLRACTERAVHMSMCMAGVYSFYA